MPSRGNSTQPSHRARQQQPDLDHDTAILGTELEQEELGEEFDAKLHETLKHQKLAGTWRDHRNRLKKMILYWTKNCPGYYKIGVRKNTPEEMNKALNWFFGGDFKEDLVYQGLNPNFVISFLNEVKHLKGKREGKFRSYDDMRKYRDAIKSGVTVECRKGERLPAAFDREIEKYLRAYKKEYQSEKKNGMAESKDADPITFELYTLICLWAVEDGNIFVLCWTQLQWNCMSRCASIAPLGFPNFKVVADAHAVLHDQTKADQEGERCFAKHIYANEENWLNCQWTGLGLYCALFDEKFEGSNNNKLFWEAGTAPGTAAKKYQAQLSGMITDNPERRQIVQQHCRLNHFNAYGFRKGPASHATAGTTMPPSLPAVAHRGDWSMGAVFDAYFKFLPTGDHFLGRILSGKDPNLASFKVLPPHWDLKNPYMDQRVFIALKANFRRLLEDHVTTDYNPSTLILRCLACMVYHSNEILNVIHHNPGHPFASIPLFMPGSNLEDLKPLVTTDPTPGYMEHATGIPPHVEIACQLKQIGEDVLALITQTKTNEDNRVAAEADFKAGVIQVIQDGIEQNNVKSGNVSGLRLERLLDDYQKRTENRLTEMMDEVVQKLASIQGQQQQSPAARIQQPRTTNGLLSIDKRSFTVAGSDVMWHVPVDFQFPKPQNLSQALRLWLKGSVLAGGKVIRPYRELNPKFIPRTCKGVKQELRNPWWQFFKKFIDTVELDGAKWDDGWPTNVLEMSDEQYRRAEEQMWKILKARVSYCFKKKGKQPTFATWARKVLKSEILLNGTEEDKSFLSAIEVAKRAPAPRKRELKQRPLYPQRRKKRTQQQSLLDHPVAGGQTSIQNLMHRGHQEDRAQGLRVPDRMIVVNRDVEANSSHLQWLLDTFGNNATGCKKRPRDRDPIRGKCACAGCVLDTCVLEGPGSHRCDRCGIPVHGACSFERGWRYETLIKDFIFCSENCSVRHRSDGRDAVPL